MGGMEQYFTLEAYPNFRQPLFFWIFTAMPKFD